MESTPRTEPPTHRRTPLRVRRVGAICLSVVAFAALTAAVLAQPQGREILNSERIEQRFGS